MALRKTQYPSEEGSRFAPAAKPSQVTETESFMNRVFQEETDGSDADELTSANGLVSAYELTPANEPAGSAALVPGSAAGLSTVAPGLHTSLDTVLIDWTSYPTISLKNEGHFEDIDKCQYGQEFRCRILGWQPRLVYRTEPYTDGKKDILFTYDDQIDHRGCPLEDTFNRWNALGKTWKRRKYMEVLVEMVAPNTDYDAEYRLLQIPEKSHGRFGGHAHKITNQGTLPPNQAITICRVGAKIEKAANPFYPWNFLVAQ